MSQFVFEKPVYRYKNLVVRVTPNEISNLRNFCKLENISVSDLVRNAVNDYAVKRKEVSIF